MNERLLSLWEYFRPISVVGSITLLHRLCSALQKSYKTGKISYNSLRYELKFINTFSTGMPLDLVDIEINEDKTVVAVF